MISFFVPGLPVAQPRQRHRVAFVGGRAVAQNYTPKGDPVNAFKAAVRLLAGNEHQAAPLTGPLRLYANFVFPRPKSKTRKENVWQYKTSKPDVDNLFKSLADALTGLLWVDDAQVAQVDIEKRVAGDTDSVGVYVQVEQL